MSSQFEMICSMMRCWKPINRAGCDDDDDDDEWTEWCRSGLMREAEMMTVFTRRQSAYFEF